MKGKHKRGTRTRCPVSRRRHVLDGGAVARQTGPRLMRRVWEPGGAPPPGERSRGGAGEEMMEEEEQEEVMEEDEGEEMMEDLQEEGEVEEVGRRRR